ncbi:MAG: prenyltransferase/squalene oxidase repeat-containing protein [Anaerolineales bacterium]|jgi:hypothetical protein
MSRKFYLTISISMAIFVLAALMAFLQPSQPAAAQPAAQNDEPDSAHIVVQFASGDALVRQIDFTAPISGLAALEASGLDVVTKDFVWGTAVCSIEGVGCPAENCFCSGNFWGNSYWDGSAWQPYMVGATDTELNDGAVDGWQWGTGADPIPPAPQFLAAQTALDWLLPHQVYTTGGYGTHSSSVEVLLDAGANHTKAADWRQEPSARSLLDYFILRGYQYANQSADRAGKLALGMSAAQGCWPLSGMTPLDYYSPTSGAFGPGASSQAFAMLGTNALSQTVPEAAVQYLKDLSEDDGGWAWLPGLESGSDTNSTSLAVQALIANGEPLTASAVISGLNFLKSAQNPDGGFTYDPDSIYGTDSDTNSTAYAVQAIWAAGQDPLTGTWVISNTNPVSYLLSMQLEDGSFEWQSGFGSNLLATQQAIPALLGKAFPFQVSTLETCPGSMLYLPLIQH